MNDLLTRETGWTYLPPFFLSTELVCFRATCHVQMLMWIGPGVNPITRRLRASSSEYFQSWSRQVVGSGSHFTTIVLNKKLFLNLHSCFAFISVVYYYFNTASQHRPGQAQMNTRNSIWSSIGGLRVVISIPMTSGSLVAIILRANPLTIPNDLPPVCLILTLLKVFIRGS